MGLFESLFGGSDLPSGEAMKKSQDKAMEQLARQRGWKIIEYDVLDGFLRGAPAKGKADGSIVTILEYQGFYRTGSNLLYLTEGIVKRSDLPEVLQNSSDLKIFNFMAVRGKWQPWGQNPK